MILRCHGDGFGYNGNVCLLDYCVQHMSVYFIIVGVCNRCRCFSLDLTNFVNFNTFKDSIGNTSIWANVAIFYKIKRIGL